MSELEKLLATIDDPAAAAAIKDIVEALNGRIDALIGWIVNIPPASTQQKIDRRNSLPRWELERIWNDTLPPPLGTGGKS